MKKVMILFFIFNSAISFANEICSRVATISYQKVLVDAGSNKKGEGLRFYLDKDPISKELLDKYQKKNKPTILSAATSTAGSLFILAGLFKTNDSAGVQNNNTLIFGGATLIAMSYLTSKTIQFSNEKILKQAVDQYNKRNTPYIYFSPYKDQNGNSSIGFGVNQEF